MTLHDQCPACGRVSDLEQVVRQERTPVRGEEIEVLIEGRRCLLCGETFSTAEEMERGLEAAYSQFRQRHGLISPAEIKSLRERYGASQKAFGFILGFGELTINTYEQGALPSEANANLLRLVERIEDFRELFEARKDLIGPTQRKRIEKALAKLEVSCAPAAVRERPPFYIRMISRPREASIFTGFLEPDRDRIFALMRAILEEAGRAIYKTQMLKLLFYCDFSHFRKTTVSISGWPYAAITYGPVPDDYEILLAETTSRGILESELDESQNGEKLKLPASAYAHQPLPELSSEELETVREVVGRLGNKTSTALVALSHREKAWLETEKTQPISYEWANELIGI